MKAHPIAFPQCLVLAGVLLLAPSASGGTKSEDSNRAWTILLYGAVDNSADDPFVAFTDQVRRAIDDDPGIELVVFIDRSNKHAKRATFLGDDFTGSRLYRVKKNSVERLSGGTHFPAITREKDVNLNSADASTLQRFLAWGKANYPAQRYGLLIYSHANGKSMCPDDRSGSEMGIAESTDEIGVKERVDFLALELCNMGGVEIAYQWRPGNGAFEADVLLAIPNAGPPLDWDRAFRRIRSPGHGPTGGPVLDPARMTAVDFGKLVIEEGHRGRQASEKPGGRGSRESAGCYDLRKAGEVKKAVDALAVALAKSNSKGVLLELRNAGSEGRLMTYSQDSSYVDLYDLCRRVAGCDRLPDPVRSAATDVLKSVQGFMIASFGMSGYQQFQEGKNGVFIVLPSGRPNCWKHYRWYSPLRGDRENYGNWSFLKDGATPGNGVVENWFELLEAWFNAADEPDGKNAAPETITALIAGAVGIIVTPIIAVLALDRLWPPLLRREFAVELPVEEAWRHLARVEQWPSWAKHIKQVEVQPPSELRPESRGHFLLTNGLKPVFRMTEFNPHRSWKWVGDFLWLTIHYDHRFEALNPTQTRLTFELEGKGFGVSLLGRLFARTYSKSLDRAIPMLVQEMNASRLECGRTSRCN